MRNFFVRNPYSGRFGGAGVRRRRKKFPFSDVWPGNFVAILRRAGHIQRKNPHMRDTKERIMEAAFALMIKNGVDAVSTGDITKALGLSRSLPYRYFSTKRELVYETFKLYFCDRFFPDPGAPAPSTLYDAVRLVADRLSEIMSSLGKSVGGRIDVFDYNALYIEALKREPRFKRYVASQSSKFSECVDRAIASGEIRPLPADFVKRVLLDVFGRSSDILSKKSPKRNLENIISDMREFYRLVKSARS